MQRRSAFVREHRQARVFYLFYPFPLEHRFEQGSAQCACQVMSAFAPVQALARKYAFAVFEQVYINV